MAKYPREEINYKKLYKNLQLNGKLNIKLEKEDLRDVITVDENIATETKPSFVLDEYDLNFCKENCIDLKNFQEDFALLDLNFLEHIYLLLKKLKKRNPNGLCDICTKKYSNEATEPMVVCQGCGLTVHSNCYGIPELIFDQWLCRRCIYHFDKGECILCNTSDGSMKKTRDGRWCHIVCASLSNYASFDNEIFKEPIIIKNRAMEISRCNHCLIESDLTVKCSQLECDKRFHTICGSQQLYCDLNNKLLYCQEHDPLGESKIQSRRTFLKGRLYPELRNQINIRENIPFFKTDNNEYLNIVNLEPFIINQGNHNPIIEDYWLNKRKTFGYFYNDPFIFSNYFQRNCD